MLPLRPSRLLTLRRAAAAVALAAGAASMSALAGQAGAPFTVTILFVPGPATCTAGVGGGVPQVQCGQAGIVSTGSPGSSANGRGAVLGYRLPDARMKVAGALVGVGEESFQAWGEYSSRFITLGGIEYLEMTVTW